MNQILDAYEALDKLLPFDRVEPVAGEPENDAEDHS
jgi:hypothetical protein